MDYAKGTHVDISKSKAEIEFLLRRAGATNIFSGMIETEQLVVVAFTMDSYPYRESIRLPSAENFTHTDAGRQRKSEAAQAAHAQACRERFRGLVLLIKAKLLAIDNGDRTWQQEFFPALVLPGGKTVYEELGDRTLEAVKTQQALAPYEGWDGTSPQTVPSKIVNRKP